ncbi:hypothetical protein [Malikia sp.]|uniref:hypothetical protein n=1 Tax=Malikia sp. TaxID=2070706 RepID=UPI0026254A42|nr:hypothetical protein [Malikia sp.]MDD2729037.1 hypothetical protein [Malikia sp.]
MAPRSDVLMLGIGHFTACPACGHRLLETQVTSTARAALAELANKITRLVR